MEKQAEDLKLYASRCSAFCLMVELALKLKGVAYDYVQEDLMNKSPALLRYNPVHKKVPVLVHCGRPLAESFVILQYVDETWPEPPLLPADPYERARVRFWIDFFHQKVAPTSRTVLISQGEEFNKAVDQLRDVVITMEEGLKGDFSGNGPFFNGATPGLLDVVMGSCSGGFRVVEELIGVELIDRQCTLFMSSRLSAFSELEVARETLPTHGTLLNYARFHIPQDMCKLGSRDQGRNKLLQRISRPTTQPWLIENGQHEEGFSCDKTVDRPDNFGRLKRANRRRFLDC